MKLKNKKTGEIKDVESLGHEKSLRDKYGPQITLSWNTEYENLGECRTYNSLAELNEEWEDAPEEPKEYWYISAYGNLAKTDVMTDLHRGAEEIGNLFDTKEEAEKAVEKLKALTKLCKKGFEFNSVEMFGSGLIRIEASIPINEKTTLQERSNIIDSLYLLFGGEE